MDGSGGSIAAGGVVPESATEAVNQTLTQLRELKPKLEKMMSLAKPEALSQMQPLQRAKAMYLIAEATTAIFTLRLRCVGVNPDDHRVRSEIERLNVYREKLQRCMDRSKEPLRFIEHSLPDLTSAQKQNIRDVSKGEKSRMATYSETAAKKRKYQSDANEFLEKAARELNSNNENGPVMAAADDGSNDAERGGYNLINQI